MITVEIKITKLNPDAHLPYYATDFSAGADIFALLNADVSIPPHETRLISTGLALSIPNGFAGFIYPRSGLATKNDLAPANKVGVIDSDYRGEVLVSLHNHGNSVRVVSNGERIAQLVIAPVVKAVFSEVSSLDDTARGSGGFGSTGTR